jgi:dimethylhistidine N-methyltransferase
MTPPDEAHRSQTEPCDDASPSLAVRFRTVRAATEALAAPLSPEDQTVQSMPDASPAKWHRAHTTWFFETFLLKRFDPSYRPYDPAFNYLFNSYYEAVGERHPRPERGAITRPSAAEVSAYRRYVDEAMDAFLATSLIADEAETKALIELGLNHEQQHQELLLTDILHAFAQNPTSPAYGPYVASVVRDAVPLTFIGFDGGTFEIGHNGDGFAFDNEAPRHRVLLEPYRLANRLTTNGEWLEFMEAGGYREASLWLSDGWQTVQREGWHAPLYWRIVDGVWHAMTLAGLHPVDMNAPVAHVSYYEAEAFARWKDARLPTEAEWERAAAGIGPHGNLASCGYLRPLPAASANGPQQMFGDVWEWTGSAYLPYPRYRPAQGAVGEYNGKFMLNQMVLRGGSCATPDGHIRATYRNFFYPHQRWQFMGVRLAKDVKRPAFSIGYRDEAFLQDVWAGLSGERKSLPCKYFYDREGSRLFDAICELPEYYLTRTDTALLRQAAPDIAKVVPENAALIEFGSGSSVKTHILLDAMRRLSAYVPVDISAEHLRRVAAEIAARYRRLSVVPVAADFAQDFALPDQIRDVTRIGFFPGSTIGNFTPDEADAFLRMARRTLGEDAYLIVGIDLVKDPRTLVAAYDDEAGVTARFNKNILARINRELDADFDLSAFEHRAVWNPVDSRMQMYLVATREQTVTVAGRRFQFAKGEAIHTENSHKYRLGSFIKLAAEAGWSHVKTWSSSSPEFAVVLLN